MMVAWDDLPISDPQALESIVVATCVRGTEVCVPKNLQTELCWERSEGCWLCHVPHVWSLHDQIICHLSTIGALLSRSKKETIYIG
jgi:hypothetical protein